MKKSKIRIFVEKEISSNLLIYIKDKQQHYLKNVVRSKIDDKIRIFDGITGEWLSKVISINRSNIVLRVVEKIKNINPVPDIWIVFAPIKQHRMNIALQKATELGVTSIVPCLTEYTDIKKINIRNLLANVIESSEQCERLDVPTISKVVDLNSLLNSWPNDRCLIFCDENNQKGLSIFESLQFINKEYKKWAVFVGPEGGFSDFEKKLISSNKNVLSVSLGSRVLRSDTAITVSLFCVQELINIKK